MTAAFSIRAIMKGVPKTGRAPEQAAVAVQAVHTPGGTNSCSTTYRALTAEELRQMDLKDLDDANIGLKGSPTKIAKASDKVRKGAGEMFTLDPEAAAAYITEKLQEKHII